MSFNKSMWGFVAGISLVSLSYFSFVLTHPHHQSVTQSLEQPPVNPVTITYVPVQGVVKRWTNVKELSISNSTSITFTTEDNQKKQIINNTLIEY